jgi:hypothetical protein
MEGHDVGGGVLVGVGVLRGEAVGDAGDFSVSGLDFDAGAENAEDLELAVVALHVVGRGGEGHPEVDSGGEHEAFGHDTDDGGGLLVDTDLAADDGERAGVALLPDGVADHEDGRGAGLSVGWGEVAAEDRVHVEHGEDAGGSALEMVGLGRNAGLAEDALLIGACFEGLEGMGLSAVVEEIGVRNAGVTAVTAFGRVGGDGDEARAAGNGHRLEKRGVDDREHHGVEADAEGEGDDDGQGEPPMGEDHAQGEAQVVGHGGWYVGGGAMVPEL